MAFLRQIAAELRAKFTLGGFHAIHERRKSDLNAHRSNSTSDRF
ncbi:hypothetical protein [Caulobacter sp. LARHSG274]